MINNIKLVSSFAAKDKTSAISNVLIKDGYMSAQNGLNGISIKVNSDIDFCCNATRLAQALNNCNSDNLKTKIKNNRIYISSGKFKSNIELYPIESYPQIDKPIHNDKIQSNIIDEIKQLSIFTDPDDVRPFANGVLISTDSIKATNGFVVVKKDIEKNSIKEKLIPTRSIQLLSKSSVFIDSISDNGSVLYFNFSDGFMFTKTIDAKYPDINKIISTMDEKTEISEISESITAIAPLCGDNKVIYIGDKIQTQKGDASFDGFDLNESAFNSDLLLKVISIADQIDFTKYPSPCPFSGEGITGAIAGIIK